MEILLIFVLLLTVAAAQVRAPASKEVPVTQEPSHHLVFENQYTRTYQVEVAPGKATLLHRHDHDYIFVAIGDADISNEVIGKAPAEQKLKDGDVEFASGGFAHVARNLASTPFRNVTIEVLRKSTSSAPLPPCVGQIGSIVLSRECLVINTDAVKVVTEELLPGIGVGKHLAHRGGMLVAVSNLHLKNDAGTGASEIQQKAGSVVWMRGGAKQTLTNASKQPARFLIVEFQ